MKKLNIQVLEVENGYVVMNNLEYSSSGQSPRKWIAKNSDEVNAIFKELERGLHEQSDKKD